jgi:hypothetical protein
VEYVYTREDGFYSSSVCSLLLTLSNMRDSPIRRIKVVSADPKVIPFEEVAVLNVGASMEVPLGIDFKVRPTTEQLARSKGL